MEWVGIWCFSAASGPAGQEAHHRDSGSMPCMWAAVMALPPSHDNDRFHSPPVGRCRHAKLKMIPMLSTEVVDVRQSSKGPYHDTGLPSRQILWSDSAHGDHLHCQTALLLESGAPEWPQVSRYIGMGSSQLLLHVRYGSSSLDAERGTVCTSFCYLDVPVSRYKEVCARVQQLA